MATMKLVCVAAVSSVMLLAPGTILASSARSHTEQKKANDAYQALSVGGLPIAGQPAFATPVAPASDAVGEQRMWPGVPGIAPRQKMVGKDQPEKLWY